MNDHDQTDAALRAKLRQFSAPPGLRTRILAQKPVARVPFWRHPGFVTAAATLILLAIALTWLLPNRSFHRFRADMIRYVSQEYRIEVHTGSFADLQQTFAQAGWPADYTVPPELQNAEVEGGCLLTWRGHKISQLCLEQAGHDVWLFIAAPGTFPPAPPEAVSAGRPTQTWHDDRATYLLIRAR